MKLTKVISLSALLVLGIVVAPNSAPRAQAQATGLRTIHTLAAATSSTVFAETSFGAYGGYNFENGAYWYRDGYPYPQEKGNDQGGWGFSQNASFGTYHPNNCHGNVDPNGLCFETGDISGYHDYANSIEVCPWGYNQLFCRPRGYRLYDYVYNPYYGYYGYFTYKDTSYDNGWINGSRGWVKNGGSLSALENPAAHRVFFTSNNPSYYPSGPQHDVPLIDIYNGGWRLCWSGTYAGSNAVSDIQSACNGYYTIMAGSYEAPEIQRPSISNPVMSSENGLVAATWTLSNPDRTQTTNGRGLLTDLENGKQFSCDINLDTSASFAENSLSCVFSSSVLKRHYSLSMSFDSGAFGTISGGQIADQLVAAKVFQATPGASLEGFACVGSTLVSRTTDLDSGAAVSYQWLRDGQVISGANSSTYTLQSPDLNHQISLRLSESKLGYETMSVESSKTGLVKKRFSRLVPPVVKGVQTVGSVLTTAVTPFGAGTSYTYQWLRDGVAIQGASDRKYILTPADLGSSVSFRVCGSKLLFETACLDSSSSVVGLGDLGRNPAVILHFRDLKVGSTLRGNSGVWGSGVVLSYQWLRDGVAIQGETSLTHQVNADDRGHNLSFKVLAQKTGYTDIVKHSVAKLIP